MTGRFAEAIAKAAAETPMASHSTPVVQGRVLLADGDGLAYYCAGGDDTDPGRARQNLIDKLNAARRASGAQRVTILITDRASHKGWRFAIARGKPYQGQRKGGRKPKNYEYMREILENDTAAGYPVLRATDCEADDLFAVLSQQEREVVIYTQDKDMRMIPGWHLDWLEHTMFQLRPDQFAVEHKGKVYGRMWFWQQMLHGDTADNIPGLPRYRNANDKFVLLGEKTSPVLLAGISNDAAAFARVSELYADFYGDEWPEQLLEQAALLWMRNGDGPLNVAQYGNPLYSLTLQTEPWRRARTAIMARIAEAMVNGGADA